MRILFSLGFWFIGLASAFAGDTDRLSIISFSKDANYFAFETYGTGDGSGLGYSEIYIVDFKKNEWVPGSPIREVYRCSVHPALVVRLSICYMEPRFSCKVTHDPPLFAQRNDPDLGPADAV